MNKFQQYITENRPAIFDWAVIAASFSLGFIFPTITDFASSSGFHFWMFAVLIMYAAGAALKHLPLCYRLLYAKQPRQVPYIIFLLVGHWFIFVFVIVLAEPAFRKLVGLPELTNENAGSWQVVLISTTLAVVITWLVYRSKTKRKLAKTHTATRLFVQECIADILLIAAVSILSFAFWEKGVMAMLANSRTQHIGDLWFLFVFLAILFLFFYLPLRYLYFMEDKSGGRNRWRLLYIFAFLLLRALFEMLDTAVAG